MIRHPLPEPLAELARGLARVLSRYPDVAVAYLFGSVARGTERPESDVDVGIVFSERGVRAADRHREIGDLIARLEAVVTPRAVDVVVLEDQGPMFCHRVLQDGLLVHETDRDRRIDFESDVIARALDFAPTWELATRGREVGLRRWLERKAP